ncbi:MAG: IS1182 family transposase [Gammaproteobacteria bacterium]
MSLHPQTNFDIPEQTITVARAAFPKGNLYMKMRDELGTIYHDELFSELYPQRGRSVQAPWRLALVTVMQFAENLTDRQAADAVRARIDWKYALSLELDDPGFDFSILSDFRARLLDGGAEELLFEQMLDLFKGRDLLKAGGRQRTDSTHIIASVRALNRLELVGETLLHALNEITQVDPVWLKAQVTPDWFERYASRFSNYRLPKSKNKRQALAEVIGADGWYLLGCIYAETIPAHLRAIPAVETLRRIWVQQFYYQEDRVRWRDKNNVPPAAVMVASPYDVEVRYSHKRGTEWRGYKVHLTETCDADQVHLITHVETTAATEQDGDVVVAIHEALARKAVVPEEHLVDGGYPSADLLVESQRDYGIDLVGPMREDQSWQARTEGAFEQRQFQVDWQRKEVICPRGKPSRYWKPWKKQQATPMIQVHFHVKDCAACGARSLCTRRKTGPRELTLPEQGRYEALHQARQRQESEGFQKQYAARSGIEGTISQAAFALGMRRSRYRGQAKTHLQHVMTAAAINLKRVIDWFDQVPRSQTYRPAFARLAAA